MHTYATLPRIPLARSRAQRALLAFLLTACATLAMLNGAAGTASAAGPNYLSPGQSAEYPTWGWGAGTTVCAQNLSGSHGRAVVRPTFNIYNLSDYIYVNAYGLQCIRRSWWGNPIVVTNFSTSAFLKTWTS